MSFSFNFTSESFTDDEIEDSSISEHQASTNDQTSSTYTTTPTNSAPISPKRLDFNELISSLKDKRLTFERVQTPGGQILFRRELFDVKHQLMAEDDVQNTSKEDVEENVLLGVESSSDLLKNIYEGGFKSWECSIDLVDKMANDGTLNTIHGGDFIELGCGTALPSCYLFTQLIQEKISGKKIVLTDYNSSVLRLVTLPNLIINWSMSLGEEELIQMQRFGDETVPIVDDELQLSEQLLARFIDDLRQLNTELHFVSGAWNSDFQSIITQITSNFGLVFTSETIYSLETLPILSDMLLSLYSRGSTVLVAAKDIYFGVGGSVHEFLEYIRAKWAQERGSNLEFSVHKVGTGLKRSIVVLEH